MLFFLENKWPLTLGFALVTLALGLLAIRKRRQAISETKSSKGIWQLIGGSAFILSFLPFGYILSSYIDTRAAWDNLLKNGIIAVIAFTLAANILRRDKFDLSSTLKNLKLIVLGIFLGLFAPDAYFGLMEIVK